MAKLSDLNDAQLDKAFAKYRSQYKEAPSPQLKKILLQMDAERKKRKAAGETPKSAPKTAKPKSIPEGLSEATATQTFNLAELSQSASILVDKSKVAKRKQEENKLANKLTIKKGQAPAINRMTTNLMMGGGGLICFLGLVLILDHFLLEWLPIFGFKLVIAFTSVAIGTALLKVANHLSDDNR